MAYDEVLAQQILLALRDAFPDKPSAPELKSRPPFVEVAQAQWLPALDALLNLGLIKGKAYRTGAKSVLQSAAYLERAFRPPSPVEERP